MKIIIIGGSIGGLCTAIALKEQGHDVQIFERSAGSMKDRGAGLVIQPDMMEYLMEKGIAPRAVFGIPAMSRQVLDEYGNVVFTYPNETIFTSWSYLWQQLKDYFDSDQYFFGYELEEMYQTETTATVKFKNGEIKTADLVVGADGYNSLVREYIDPNIRPVYAGYVAYRGLIPERQLSNAQVSFFANKFSIFPYEHSHLLCYMVPGPRGELTEGKRLFNWVWYLNKTVEELDQLVTDKDGFKRAYSVPAGLLSEDNHKQLDTRAYAELPEILRDRVLQTEQPFVQVIVDLAARKMFKGRIVIIGDAASVVRPHTASGTAKAFRDGIALASSLQEDQDLETVLSDWNHQQIRYANALISHGKQLAARSQLG